jgi:hypothetical protein
MPYKDPTKRRENARKYREKNRKKINEKKKEHYEKNKEEINEKNKEQYKKNKEKNKEKQKEYRDDRTQNAHDSITSGRIFDPNKWDLWCDGIKIKAKTKKHPYSDEFTNDIMFDLMVRGCYYCGNIATTIDRLNSELDHTLDNCVGCCGPCNISKGVADPSTFIRKSYYKARGEYIDDVTNVWFENKNKPQWCNYRRSANKKEITFELTRQQWKMMIADDCEYCHRSPTTWFGIDRVVPSLGYVDDNVVTCCYDCNLDKHVNDVEATIARNERIANRVDSGVLKIREYGRVIVHRGMNKSSKKVCVYGKVFVSQNDASRALKKDETHLSQSDNYVGDCIHHGRHSDDIFEISDDFYDFVISNNLENITKKMYVLFGRM